MAGRPRKPSNILEASGQFLAHPERKRARANEPKSRGEIGEPPEWMTAAQRQVWADVLACVPEYTACEFDREAFIGLVRLAETVRQPKFLLGATEAYMRALSRFGMTPADRSRVMQLRPDKGDENPFAKFAGGK